MSGNMVWDGFSAQILHHIWKNIRQLSTLHTLHWTCSLIHLLFLGGGKEANHLHCLLQPFKVMTQVFLIFYLKVLLQRKLVGVHEDEKMKARAQNGKIKR